LRFVDTNVLLYSISTDPGETSKKEIAVALLDNDDLALSVQVLQEFYVQATRPTRADALPHDLVSGLISTWLRFPVQDVTVAIVLGALEIKAAHGLSYWDAAIVSAARALGCDEVLSEDLAHGRHVEGVQITNPFR
jgi:predicted nucleic acid-binding protein